MSNWLTFGTGIGIEIAAGELRVVAVRVRPSGLDVLGAHVIVNYQDRPAAEWGREFSEFAARHGAAHLAATVILPRREVIVRVVTLAGVEARDMEAALRLQIDSMHPYPEGEAAWTFARLAKSHSLLVGIVRQGYVDRHLELLTEAGIKVASFTFSAAALYGALRLLGAPPADGVLGLVQTDAGIEAYGESPARLIYSAAFSEPWERAAAIAGSELRLEQMEPRELSGITPKPAIKPENFAPLHHMAYVAAMAAACPRYALAANLLPQALRRQSSRLIYVPSLALGALLLLGLVSLGFYGRYEDRKYLDSLNDEVRMLDPRVRHLQQVELRIAQLRQRIRLLDSFQARTKNDLDAVKEITRVVPSPTWLSTMELTRSTLTIAGESDQATGLLKAIDSSAHFQNSEFVVPLSRVGQIEIFRIRALREGAQ